ncbi:hypothetical protein [Maribellus maritimus]|uniref:hypothetical protein n=1 Tax=Maribellus maritimus TaxID=2870838 RepID=UPI001EECB303|nr:hypothetical protein [Maribellus maritimus]MCG6190877.1 hypothetical protein [Maribellus maritimus]
MKKLIIIFYLLLSLLSRGKAQDTIPDFSWGNAHYFNLNEGDSCTFNKVNIKLLRLENHYNHIKVGEDTLCVKVSRRTLPVLSNGLRFFVADNKNVKSITSDSLVHGLLTKDALICVSNYQEPLLNPYKYSFPVNFNDGFIWNTEVDGYMFAYMGEDNKDGEKYYRSHEGIDLDLSDARGLEKHWIVALENSEVEWIEEYEAGNEKAACVLLRSESTPQIFYVYEGLLAKSLEIRKGHKIIQGEILGTVWGDENDGFLQLSVIHSTDVPQYAERFNNAVNFFPQLFLLYYNQTFSLNKNYSKGRIVFGKNGNASDENKTNIHSYENYIGKGWLFDHWNISQRVDCICNGDESNARLNKVLFAGSPAEKKNPENNYDYEISVSNGTYRIRAKVGDLEFPSWQKVELEGIEAGTFDLNAGEYKWTNERVVKVNDGKLSIRIYVDSSNRKVAGLSEIVFQKVN